VSAFVEDCRSARAKPLLFLGEAGGAGGKAPCIQTYGKQGSSEVGFCGTIGRRKRAVDALASTVPFFGVADRTAKERAVKGLRVEICGANTTRPLTDR